VPQLRHLAKNFFKKIKKQVLPSAWAVTLGKEFFLKNENSLPSVALGKENIYI
jgi:hypothetical protein